MPATWQAPKARAYWTASRPMRNSNRPPRSNRKRRPPLYWAPWHSCRPSNAPYFCCKQKANSVARGERAKRFGCDSKAEEKQGKEDGVQATGQHGQTDEGRSAQRWGAARHLRGGRLDRLAWAHQLRFRGRAGSVPAIPCLV